MENNTVITYQGNQISLYSDERDFYVDLTEMAKAWKGRKSILTWIRNRQSIEYLSVWEKKHNTNFNGAHLSTVFNLIKERTLSIKKWVELTNAKGIITRAGGEEAGTYAHKDIAIRFAAWLSPEFELFLVEKIQELSELERKKSQSELLTHDEIIELVKLKEVFKYVAHQEIVEDAHKEVYASKSTANNPYAEFNTWRNKILDTAPATIDERIKEYCRDNNIALTKKMLSAPKRDKILRYDSYETVRHAVWDFLQMKGEINALNLANLVRDIIKTEKGEMFRKNENTLFENKQDLGQYTDFKSSIGNLPQVKTARALIDYKKGQDVQMKNLSDHNQKLLQALKYNPKDGESEE